MIIDQSRISPDVVRVGVSSDRPIYVYDIERIRARCRDIEAIPVARKSIYFATMANDHPAVLSSIRACGHGVFVNSRRHLELARSLGFPPRRIIYAATNMSCEEMTACQKIGVRMILDSLQQLKLFASRATPGEEVGLRLSVGSALDGEHFKDDPLYRFGLCPAEAREAVEVARRHRIRIVGAHSYFGTDLMSPELLAEAMDELGRAAEVFPDLRYLDVGGGFGVTPRGRATFDVPKYGRLAAAVMASHEQRMGRPLELILEPGRYLAAGCGYFFVKVMDVKLRQDRVFVGTNGSVAIFPRPLLYPDIAAHRCELVGAASDQQPADDPIFICGNSTYSRDFLARNVRLPLPAIGDTIVFHDAGAYCRSMITDFLGKDRPDEVVIDRPALVVDEAMRRPRVALDAEVPEVEHVND